MLLVFRAYFIFQFLLNTGFWDMIHESRTDWTMIIGNIFILIKGGGYWTFDRKIMKGKKWN